MKNTCVRIFTITGEMFICIILEEDRYRYYYKSEYSEGYIFKDDIKEIEIIGDAL